MCQVKLAGWLDGLGAVKLLTTRLVFTLQRWQDGSRSDCALGGGRWLIYLHWEELNEDEPLLTMPIYMVMNQFWWRMS